MAPAMNHFFVLLLLIVCFSHYLESLRVSYSDQVQRLTRRQPMCLSMQSSSTVGKAPLVAVVGYSGSAAEVAAYKLAQTGYDVKMLLDDTPVSPFLQEVPYYCGELDQEMDDASGKMHSPASILQNRLVVVVGDSVADEDQLKDDLAGPLFNKLSKILPSNVKGVICASGASEEASQGGLGNIFGNVGSTVFEKFVQSNDIPFSVVRYGKLTGGIPGAEPIPFMGFPLIEPEVHPSYVLRSVVLSNAKDNKYSAIEPCTRDSLGETLTRLIATDLYKSSTNFNAQVISLAGPPPSEKDWKVNFAKLAGGKDVELLRMEFSEIIKEKAFSNWIADQWFPQALIDADAATIIAGARPVKAVKQENGNIKIFWEELKPDLSVLKVGEIEVRLENTDATKALSVIRLSGEALPGESQLMDRLLEAVNKNAVKKNFVAAPTVS